MQKKESTQKMNDLRKRAIQRKLSCPAIKTQTEIQKEKEHFEHIKENLYSQIGR